jgi:hypothetical protein
MFLLRLITFDLLFSFVELNIYLYNTQDGHSIEYYDCFMVQSLFYCRRPTSPIDLVRDNDTISCEENGGTLHLMSQLRTDGVSISTVLHEWKSGLDRVERYSRYVTYPHSYQSDGYLCACFDSQSFGKNCEYRLPFGTTTLHTLEWQLKIKSQDKSEVQKHSDIICYKTWDCDSGLLCLDWREICDGVQHCVYGYDEYNCYLLELNQCAEDEYRCMNGMCIPDEYFLDGDFDCLDWSDEIQYKEDKNCHLESTSSVCDDRICPLHEWSCGDGQCIPDRFQFQTTAEYECSSRRDQWFMCETHRRWKRWTMSNGQCFGKENYTELKVENDTDGEVCEHLLRCSFTEGLETGCQCSVGEDCNMRLRQECLLDKIKYPKGQINGPGVSFLFNSVRNWTDRLPDWIVINGSVQCGGFLVSAINQ